MLFRGKWFGVASVVLGALAIVPLGLAIFNVAQGVRLADDTTFPLFIRAMIVEANAHRFVVFSVITMLLVLAGIALGVAGVVFKGGLPGKLALGLLGVEVLALSGTGVLSRKMPSATELRSLAAAEKKAEEDADEEARASASKAGSAAQKAGPSKRLVAYTLGSVVGMTALGRANGASSAVVDRQVQRASTLAGGLGVSVAPFPALTGKRLDDDAAALDYVLQRGGKDLAARVKDAHGEGAAALVELGLKTAVARMLYLPKGSTNAAYVTVLERTARTARLSTPTVAAATAKIKANAPRTEVLDALDAMERAVKQELETEPESPTVAATASDDGAGGPVTLTAAALTTTPVAATATAPAPARASAPKAVAASSGKPATARVGFSRVNGSLPSEVVDRVLRANSGRFSACYDAGLRSNPKLRGRVTVKFVIGRTGTVVSSSDGGSDLADASVVSCMMRSVSGMSFPSPQGGIATVTAPIVLAPGG